MLDTEGTHSGRRAWGGGGGSWGHGPQGTRGSRVCPPWRSAGCCCWRWALPHLDAGWLFLLRNHVSFALISVLLFFSGIDHVDTRIRNSHGALDAASAAGAAA